MPLFAFARLGSPLRWTNGGIGVAMVVHSARAASERWRIQKHIHSGPALHHSDAPRH